MRSSKQWRIKIPEVSFVTDVTDLEINTTPSYVGFGGKTTMNLIELTIKFIVLKPHNAPDFMERRLGGLTILAKELDGVSKIKFNECSLMRWDLEYKSYGGLEYKLAFNTTEMQTIIKGVEMKFEDLVWEKHPMVKDLDEEAFSMFGDEYRNAKRALYTAECGLKFSIVSGTLFYSNGIDTYEIWVDKLEDIEEYDAPEGYLTEDEVVEYILVACAVYSKLNAE